MTDESAGALIYLPREPGRNHPQSLDFPEMAHQDGVHSSQICGSRY